MTDDAVSTLYRFVILAGVAVYVVAWLAHTYLGGTP